MINGKGRIYKDQEDANNGTTIKANEMPLANFFVNKGSRYRFRMFSPGFTLCPVLLSIDKHKMTVIGTDSSSITPVRVRSLIIHPGER